MTLRCLGPKTRSACVTVGRDACDSGPRTRVQGVRGLRLEAVWDLGFRDNVLGCLQLSFGVTVGPLRPLSRGSCC